ncbi:type II toxin-antitoxin system HicB family antitoxin [Gymnodinialimonas sp.]
MNDYAIVISAVSEEDGGGFIAFYPDLPGCMSDGETREEALKNGKDAFGAWMNVQRERGAEIPAPGDAYKQHEGKMDALFKALKSVIDYVDHAEDRITSLEDELESLIKAMREDWRSSGALASHANLKARQVIAKH